jgi:hypothetical protein
VALDTITLTCMKSTGGRWFSPISSESRTQLRLNVEIEEQKQKLADLKITKEQERAKSGIYLLHNLRVSNEDYSRKRLCTIHVCVYIHLA